MAYSTTIYSHWTHRITTVNIYLGKLCHALPDLANVRCCKNFYQTTGDSRGTPTGRVEVGTKAACFWTGAGQNTRRRAFSSYQYLEHPSRRSTAAAVEQDTPVYLEYTRSRRTQNKIRGRRAGLSQPPSRLATSGSPLFLSRPSTRPLWFDAPGAHRLFIIGGSPLTNDVWAADIVLDASGSWSLIWEEMASGNDVPFSPRAGLGKPGQSPTSTPPAVAIGCEHGGGVLGAL